MESLCDRSRRPRRRRCLRNLNRIRKNRRRRLRRISFLGHRRSIQRGRMFKERVETSPHFSRPGEKCARSAGPAPRPRDRGSRECFRPCKQLATGDLLIRPGPDEKVRLVSFPLKKGGFPKHGLRRRQSGDGGAGLSHFESVPRYRLIKRRYLIVSWSGWILLF